jgi:hypothetical protein
VNPLRLFGRRLLQLIAGRIIRVRRERAGETELWVPPGQLRRFYGATSRPAETEHVIVFPDAHGLVVNANITETTFEVTLSNMLDAPKRVDSVVIITRDVATRRRNPLYLSWVADP